jgi:cell division transport system permease protein
LHGVVSALFAFALLGGLYFIVRNQVEIDTLNIISTDFVGLLLLCLLALGLLVSMVSTYFALNRSLDMNMDDLYY